MNDPAEDMVAEGGPVSDGPKAIVRHLSHDFNAPTNKGGFHEVVLDNALLPPWPGEIVEVGDSELRMLGRVRCLIAVVEQTGPFVDLDER